MGVEDGAEGRKLKDYILFLIAHFYICMYVKVGGRGYHPKAHAHVAGHSPGYN